MTQPRKKKVAVLMGGWSSEREISLIGGSAVCKALSEMGHDVIAIDVQRDPTGLVQALTKQASGKPDVIFNALRGRGGEDGTMQGLLEFVGVPYTHSPVLASALAMDKPAMKQLAQSCAIPCAKGVVARRAEIVADGYPLPLPFVIKPTNEGSSVGVRIVQTPGDLAQIEEDGWIYGDQVLIEEYIPGLELTVGLLGHGGELRVLGVSELRPRKQAFYDYTAKSNADETEHLNPAPIPQDIAAEAARIAKAAYRAAGCHGAAQIDLRWDSSFGLEGLKFLEINTQPNLTPAAALPRQAAQAGLSFNDLVSWMIEHPTCPV